MTGFYLVWKFFTGTLSFKRADWYIPAHLIDLGEFDVVKSERAEAGLLGYKNETTYQRDEEDGKIAEGDLRAKAMRLALKILGKLF